MNSENVVFFRARQGDGPKTAQQQGDRSVTFLVRDLASGKVRYEIKLLEGSLRKDQLELLITDYRSRGFELLHAFVGAECLMMKFYVEMEEAI